MFLLHHISSRIVSKVFRIQPPITAAIWQELVKLFSYSIVYQSFLSSSKFKRAISLLVNYIRLSIVTKVFISLCSHLVFIVTFSYNSTFLCIVNYTEEKDLSQEKRVCSIAFILELWRVWSRPFVTISHLSTLTQSDNSCYSPIYESNRFLLDNEVFHCLKWLLKYIFITYNWRQ